MWGFEISPIFRSKKKNKIKKQYHNQSAEHVGIHTYFATFAESHYCIAAYLPSCWKLIHHITFQRQPANLQPLNHFRRSLLSMNCSCPWQHPCLQQYLVSTAAVVGDHSKLYLTYFDANKAIPQNQNLYMLTMATLLEMTAHHFPDSMVLCHGMMPGTVNVILSCGQHHSGKYLLAQTSRLVRLKTKARKSEHFNIQGSLCSHITVAQKMHYKQS